MSKADEILSVMMEWVAKAENDLENAARVLRIPKRCPTDTVCFHAQQCLEKYLKAFLVFSSMDFPKTHDIRLLISLLPPRARPKLTREEQRKLTGYATVARYPGWGEISLAEARKAVRLARRVRAGIRKHFPQRAFQRRSG